MRGGQAKREIYEPSPQLRMKLKPLLKNKVLSFYLKLCHLESFSLISICQAHCGESVVYLPTIQYLSTYWANFPMNQAQDFSMFWLIGWLPQVLAETEVTKAKMVDSMGI